MHKFIVISIEQGNKSSKKIMGSKIAYKRLQTFTAACKRIKTG